MSPPPLRSKLASDVPALRKPCLPSTTEYGLGFCILIVITQVVGICDGPLSSPNNFATLLTLDWQHLAAYVPTKTHDLDNFSHMLKIKAESTCAASLAAFRTSAWSAATGACQLFSQADTPSSAISLCLLAGPCFESPKGCRMGIAQAARPCCLESGPQHPKK